jgi:hypothetical protein
MMRNRILLFLIGCIGLRTALVFIAKNTSVEYLPYLGYLALIPVLGWMNIYFIQGRDTGPEVFGGKIWWNQLRPVHAMLYGLFALYAIQKKSYAYIPLAVDVVFGLVSFLVYHNTQQSMFK